jgi:hypothetical protein
MPSQSVKPLRTPIRLTLPDGNELISSIDPVTNMHSVQCDLCGKVNQLGPQGANSSIFQHRNSVGCKARIIRQTKEEARAHLRVSYVYYDWLYFEPDRYVIRLEEAQQKISEL